MTTADRIRKAAPMTALECLAAGRLRECLSYDKESGVFVWLVSRQNRSVGDVAGYRKSNGYTKIGLDGSVYGAHRLAYLHVTGSWPSGVVDHIDGDPSNNRWSNLRDVPHRTNIQNERVARKNNSTGFLGVSPKEGRFVATIRVDGRKINIGSFKTPEEAHVEYLSAKRRYHEGATI
jgi:hypothetical protein